MPRVDPGLNPNCPKCPRPLRYIMSVAGGAHIYECSEHGRWRMARDGGFYPMLTKPETVDEALAALQRMRKPIDPSDT
jgi:hypothetical protein